jgi:hypothetical protein
VVSVLDHLLVAAWAGSASWVNHDARRRLRTPGQHRLALGSALLFPVGGVLLYLLLRPPDSLLDRRERRVFRRLIEEEFGFAERCYACRAEVRPDFVCCPACGEKLRERCRSCAEPLRLHWRICPRCETSVKTQVGLAA